VVRCLLHVSSGRCGSTMDEECVEWRVVGWGSGRERCVPGGGSHGTGTELAGFAASQRQSRWESFRRSEDGDSAHACVVMCSFPCAVLPSLPPPHPPRTRLCVHVTTQPSSVGARIALQFHRLREHHPSLFCSRLVNKVGAGTGAPCACVLCIPSVLCSCQVLHSETVHPSMSLADLVRPGGGAERPGAQVLRYAFPSTPFASRSPVLAPRVPFPLSCSPPPPSPNCSWLPFQCMASCFCRSC
jgi:hypothetical protein